jgi:hypothetical protein
MKHLTLIIAVLALLGTSNAFATTVTMYNNTDYIATYDSGARLLSCKKIANKLPIYHYKLEIIGHNYVWGYDGQGEITQSKIVVVLAYAIDTNEKSCANSIYGQSTCWLVQNVPASGASLHIVRYVGGTMKGQDCTDAKNNCTIPFDEKLFALCK